MKKTKHSFGKILMVLTIIFFYLPTIEGMENIIRYVRISLYTACGHNTFALSDLMALSDDLSLRSNTAYR